MRFGQVDDWAPNARHQTVRRYGFVLVSLAVHALLIVLLYYFGAYQLEMAQQREQASVGARLARQSSIEKRVLDMEKIKDLMDQSRSGAPPSDGAGTLDEPDFSATSLPKPPEQLLAQARQLAAAIAKTEKELKATELARIENIPKEQALARLESAPENAAPQDKAASPPDATPAQLAVEIQQLEARARVALAQRRQDLARQRSGVAVNSDKGAAGQARDSGSKPGTGVGGVGSGDEYGGDGHATAPSVINDNAIEQRMAAFINRDVALPTGTVRNYTRGGEAIFNAGGGNIPPVHARTMTKGAGRILGRGGEFADRVYINSWYLIGPFEGKHGRGLFTNHRYPPEQGVVLDAVYAGKGNRRLKWRYVNAARYPLVPPEPDEDAVYYGYTEVMMDRDQELTMWIGADDDGQIWLNDVQVWAGGNINKRSFWPALYDVPNTHARDYNMTEGKRKVRFRKGRNKIFFKMANGPTRLFFSLVLTK